MLRLASLMLLIHILSFRCAQSQPGQFVIRFRDKGSNLYSLQSPQAFLSDRSIERRSRQNIAIDSSDLPVTTSYVDSIRLSGNVEILNTSKWLNQVAIRTYDSTALVKIKSFPFVLNTIAIGQKTTTGLGKFSLEGPALPELPQGIIQSDNSYGRAFNQINLHHGQFLHDLGFNGASNHIAVLDAGFFNYHKLSAFDSIRLNNRIVDTWDFVKNESEVKEDFYHGTICLSMMAANIPGTLVGTAPGSKYYLFRTEDVSTEYPVEEHYLAAGAERADSIGADIITASIGYTRFSDPVYDYSYSDLDGNTTMSARAADLAASKGILFFAATGNEGNTSWKYITTPADADSVISVGAVDSLGNVGNFSSFGPSADGQIKPNLASLGWNAVVPNTGNGNLQFSTGSSLACPNLAGLASCLWQAFPELGNMQIKDLLERSADKADSPDVRTGFGIPDMKKAFVLGIRAGYRKGNLTQENCMLYIPVKVKSDSSMNIYLERRFPEMNKFERITSYRPKGLFESNELTFSENLTYRPRGPVFYKLIMEIGTDTSFTLDSFRIDFEQDCAVEKDWAKLYQPFPDFKPITLRIGTLHQARIDHSLHDMGGHLIEKRSFVHPEGISVYPILIDRLPAGTYLLTVWIDNRKQWVKKLIRP
jgi:serine protease AprX